MPNLKNYCIIRINKQREFAELQSHGTQQQGPESPTVTLTWHASKCKVPQTLPKVYILKGITVHAVFLNSMLHLHIPFRPLQIEASAFRRQADVVSSE